MSAAPSNFSLAEKLVRERDLRLRDAARARRECRCLRPCRGDRIYSLETSVVERGEGDCLAEVLECCTVLYIVPPCYYV